MTPFKLPPGANQPFLRDILSRKQKVVTAMEGKKFPARTRRRPISLEKALKAPGPAYIFEVKKASPALGDIRPEADVAACVNLYAPFANALSVLTEETFFKGSVEDLRTAGEATQLPLLAKDFFIDPAQIREAHSAGADAILLILSILGDEQYKLLSGVAQGLGLEVLTEVHAAAEMERAKALEATIIGINNRDLTTLEININTTKKVARGAPHHAVLVSESGFSERREILSLARTVDAFLIGGAVMAAERPDLKIRELVFGRVKICGFTNPADARLAYDSGAIYGGLNFVENTPRLIDPGQGPEIMAGAPLKWVGVFRNTTPSFISAVVNYLGLSAVQLHGVEDEKFRRKLKKLLPKGVEIWQAVEGPKYTPENCPGECDRVLLDSKRHRVFGGTGHIFGWRGLKNFEEKDHLALAGGLTPGNVKKALKVDIPLLDICSGLEIERGIKSPEKIKAFFAAIRRYKGAGRE